MRQLFAALLLSGLAVGAHIAHAEENNVEAPQKEEQKAYDVNSCSSCDNDDNDVYYYSESSDAETCSECDSDE